MGRRIAYYAHDAGSGHLRHAANVARHPDLDVLVMSSRPPRSSDRFQHTLLPTDVVDDYQMPSNGLFHYVPVAPAIRHRFHALHEALHAWDPEVVFVDVSVEVAAFARLCGYPVVARRMHGRRTDRAHGLMYDLADAMLAYYGDAFEEPSYLDQYGMKTTFAGMLDPSLALGVPSQNEVVVLTSLGGSGVHLPDVAAAAQQTPTWHWTVVGQGTGEANEENLDVVGVVEDVNDYLSHATVVIASAGHNAVRAGVGARRPLLLMPEPRPYDEQQLFAEALAAHGDASLIGSWKQDWNAVLSAARRQDPHRLADALLVDERSFFASITKVLDAAVS